MSEPSITERPGASVASFIVACPTCGWKFTAHPYTTAVSAYYTHQELSPSCAACEIWPVAS